MLAAFCGGAFAHGQVGAPVLVNDGATRVIETWAPKGMTQSPVAICFDPKGNLYLAESDRAGNAVQDTRNIERLHAVEDDLRFKTIEDRRAQIRRWIAAGEFPPDYFTRTEDRVRVLSDTDGDGLADRAGVFAGGFNNELDGIGAGLLWRDEVLYYTCIPHLWTLADRGDLQAGERKTLATGFGVRWCFFGHDLHGLAEGPDGRIYFSMGDRGYNVTTREGARLVGPDRGGVFRCWPDGSELELFYEGLRNPQELAFNELGDLFTGDNNCDSGDLARVVHVVEGGDSGWRQDVQSLDSRGPWNRESIWRTLKDSSGPQRPAWALPPVEYMCAGPSGLSFYPGTGESRRYDGCFFLVDFYGSGATVHTFRCLPQGAGFKVADHSEYYKGLSITDVAWGPDSRLYMSDWGGGWQPNPNGTVITVTNKTVRNDPAERAAIENVAQIIRAGHRANRIDELIGMLSHRDQRVRLGAQYELARRTGAATTALKALTADRGATLVARAHAIWAVGQISRQTPEVSSSLLPLLDDPEPEIRVQAVRTLGDLRNVPVSNLHARFAKLLSHTSARVRLAAAIALGRTRAPEGIAPLLQLLRVNDNKDLTLRHGAAYALALIGDRDRLMAHLESAGAAERLGMVVALRRLGDEAVSRFLEDPDPAVAIEAARAVYDLRLEGGLTRLAELLSIPLAADRAIEPLMRRVIEANVLLGSDDCVQRLAAFAAQAGSGAPWRRLALRRLEGWDRPLDREGVWGNWAGLPGRSVGAVERAVRGHIEAIISSAADDQEALALAYRLQVRHALELSAESMAAQVADGTRPENYRLALLDRLGAAHTDRVGDTAETLLSPTAATPGPLRRRAQELLARTDPDRAVRLLLNASAGGAVVDRQHVVRLLGSIQTQQARAAIAGLARNLRYGSLEPELALDVYMVCMALPSGTPARSIAEEAGKQGQRPAGYSNTLLARGGNADAGREIFLHHRGAECLRCHTVAGLGGTAGPDLSTVARRLTTETIVESVVEPGAAVARGYGEVTAMPAIPQFLSPGEVRDVVAYLRTLGAAPERPSTIAAAHSTGIVRPALGWMAAALVAGVAWRALRRPR